jgi:flagellar basal body-associated protein FliL
MKRGGMRTPTIFLKKNRRGAGWNRKGQVTIFIILAIIIVALAFLIYSFWPQIKTTIGTQQKDPQAFMQSCIETDIKEAVDKVSLQGGSIAPENYILYNDNKVEYLCYTDEFYRNCIVQQPMLKLHTELEIRDEISDNVESCFASLKDSYEKKGYDVSLEKGDKTVELLPKRIVTTFNYSLTLTKGDTQEYDSFVVMLDNNLYELVSIVNSIIEWEATYGDADPTTYMTYYPDLKVEKKLNGSGDKIYILTDRNTGNKFEFAIKGQVWPAGYAKTSA